MTAWAGLMHFGGFDWASEHHDVVIVDKTGKIVADFRFDEVGEGWRKFREDLKAFAPVGVVIETRHGAVVDRLLESGCTVFPVNPKAAERYRERKAPSGSKTDRLDAWSLADALRMDGQSWKALKPEDEHTQELRQLCRDEVTLIEQRTALVNQLQSALREYYPAALDAFDDWTRPATWDFIEKFPGSKELKLAGKRRWEKFLHVHRLYRAETVEKRLSCFEHATDFSGTPGTTSAKKLLALTLVKMLKALQKQLDEYRERITQCFEKHPDHDVFGSLPGAGEKIGPRLLGEIGTDRDRFDNPNALQCYAGTAPVTQASGRRSGKSAYVHIRRACNKRLRRAIHFLADLSRTTCTWAQVYYRKKRDEGQHHAAALRCLGQRWIKIVWAMWRNKTVYDPEMHLRNQVKHGSWVISLLNTSDSSPTTAPAK